MSKSPENTIATRAQHLLKPTLTYIVDQGKALFTNRYHPKTNPNGVIALGVAENKLMHDLLLKRIRKFAPPSDEVLNYTWPQGSPELRKVVGNFLSKYIFNLSNPTEEDIKTENLIINNGCTSILHALSFVMFDENDSLLIPTPYYPYFDYDFSNLNRVHLVDVHNVNETYTVNDDKCSITMSTELTGVSLDKAYAQSVSEGYSPKAILLTNPNNPTGTVYSPETLRAIVQWSRSHKVHVICDEIYALSVFGHIPSPLAAATAAATAAAATAAAAAATDVTTATDTTHTTTTTAMSTHPSTHQPHPMFHSIVEVLNNELSDDVHVIWGLSKDFGCSGLRFGVLYTQNQSLLTAMGNLSAAFQVSHQTQDYAQELLAIHPLPPSTPSPLSATATTAEVASTDAHHLNDNDNDNEQFIKSFVHQNQVLLHRSFSLVQSSLRELRIPIVDTYGGIFVMADFRSCLSELTFEAEDEFRRFLLFIVGLSCTPGGACHHPLPGFFRFCYAFVDYETLELGMSRLKIHLPVLIMKHSSSVK